MEITRLKLSGFKSFVEPAELRIEPGLTGIVGPNGCGKSNLLEALRWVMGEASARSLRGGAMDDVIFAGTGTRPARDFAEVAVQATGVSSLGGDAEIVRRIDRGAGSGYRINGNDVRAKDVALLFADAATGAHSPALVSQGRIGAIISARPGERRLMLEEAAGISGLHVRRKDAEQKLRATETNLEQVDTAIADMDARVAQLRRQARAAERYRALSDAIRIAEARLIFARWQTAARAADAAKAEAASAEADVARASGLQRAIAGQLATTTTALATCRQHTLSQRDAALAANHKVSTLRTERDGLTRRITDIIAQTERLTEDRAREGALANDAAAMLTARRRALVDLEATLVTLEAGAPALADQLRATERDSQNRELDLAKALAEQAREHAEAKVAEAAFQVAQRRLDRAKQEHDGCEAQMKALGDDMAALSARQAAASTIKRCRAEIERLAVVITEADAKRQTAAAEREIIESDVAANAAALAALESEAQALRKAIDSGSTGSRALDLVRAERGYEKALAAAIGDDLDASIGEEGRRVWRGAVARPDDPALPPGTSSLVGHVDAPSALERRLSQIAVVERDDGQALAVGQRLVTRDGQMRRWDGLVAREHGTAAADRMIKINRLMDVQQDIEPTRAALKSAREALDRIVASVGTATSTARDARTEIARFEAELRTAQRAEDQATGQLERSAARRAELAQRIAHAKAERSAAEAEHKVARQARLEVPDGTSLNRLVASLTSATNAARIAVADLRARITAHSRDVDATRAQIIAARSDIKTWEARAGDAAQRIAEMTRRAKATEAEAQTLAGAPARIDAELATAQAEARQCGEAADAARAQEMAAEDALRTIEAEAARVNEVLSAAREARARAQTRAENEELRRVEMGRVSGERFACPPPLLPERVGFDAATILAQGEESAALDQLTQERDRMGPVNLIAEQEVRELEAARDTAHHERSELAEAVHRLRGSIGALNREGRQRLLAAFAAVDQHFQRLFGTLFMGGSARLELIDSDDPLEAGLEIFAQPPGKKLTSLSLLSGGEQALTAIALIFGLFLTNPAPICVLDEVDAPLDDANIERFCDLLDAMTRETRTRYLIVTHNAVTMSRMHRLFGVTMVEQGVSRLVSVDLSQAERLVA